MSAQHGFLNHSSRLATQISPENFPSFSTDFTTTPDHSGINNNSNVNPQNTGTILSPNASRFDQQPWLPPPQSVRHLPNDNSDLPPLPPTPNQPSVNFEHSNQPHISFEDQPLFPPPSRPQQQTARAAHNQSTQSLTSAPSGVDAILQRLGHNTTSSQFTHRPLPQSNTAPQYSNRPIQTHSQAQYLRQTYQNRALGRQYLHLKQNLSPLFLGQQARMTGILNSPSENMKEEDLADWLQVGGGDGSEFSSPNFAHIHDPTINLSTISPQDIFNYHNSTPMSTSLMSPFLDDESSYETSPLFNGEQIVGGDDHWPSLFPDESPFEPSLDADIQDILNSGLDEIKNEGSSSPSASPTARSSISGRKGSTTGAGVRKRTAPLPPIVVDDMGDHVAVKRARNTLAARKSREKKVKKMEEMEIQIEELKQQVEHWKQLYQKQGRMPNQ
ncbi:hypothetical protein DFH27DRAFT_242855 [Peziza echinospora]|nr:hypothetical protein DFH27DRAFT_242855 [Peziza echinospora]